MRSLVRFPPDAGLFYSLSIPQWCILYQVPQRGASLLIFHHKKQCLAVQLGAKEAKYVQIWQKILVIGLREFEGDSADILISKRKF